MDFNLVGLLLIVLFYAAFFIVGSLQRFRKEGLSDLLLAGRNLPIWIGIATMTATWVDGGYLNGTAEAVYDSSRGLVWAQAPWGYSISLVLGGLFFARTMRRRSFTTLLDAFSTRYGEKIGAWLYLPALLGEVFWSSAILAALGTTFGSIIGLDFGTAILLSAAVATGYTVFGGLKSVAYTDALQLICIVLGLGLVIPFAVHSVGGMGSLLDGYFNRLGAAAFPIPPWQAWGGSEPWGWAWTDSALLLMLGGIPWQVYFQRVLACPDEKSAVRLSVAAGFCCFLLAIPPAIIGAAGATFDWTSAGLSAPPAPAMVLPYVLKFLTPPVVALIGLAAVSAAVMSSVDSSILSAASMFSWNVYRALVRKQAGDRELLLVMRMAIVGVGLGAGFIALKVGSIYTLWMLCSDLVYVILFPQLVMALYSRRANAAGAVAGALVALFLRLGGGEAQLGLDPFLPYPWNDAAAGILFPFRTFAMLSGLATIWLVSRMTAGRYPPTPLDCCKGES